MPIPIEEFKSSSPASKQAEVLEFLRSQIGQAFNVTELSKLTGIAQSNMSKYLKNLREADLIEYKRIGRAVYYAVEEI
jgi:DNA-binding MarR family transcriptional regulator